MTNREYLNTLNNEDFVNAVISINLEIEIKSNKDSPDFDVFDSNEDIAQRFEDWCDYEYEPVKFLTLPKDEDDEFYEEDEDEDE